MKKRTYAMSLVFFFLCMAWASAQENPKAFLLDDFEGDVISDPKGTIDAGSGNGSSVVVSADRENKKSGEQSLKIDYDAVGGGYIWVARGYQLDVKGAALWTKAPQDIDWSRYGAISVYLLGEGSGARIAFDIKDAGGEIFRTMITDDTKGWKQVVAPFDQFLPRGDWQPAAAEVNGNLDFPVMSFQFEPIAVAKGVIHVDAVTLEPLN
ncbi:MAG: carbohydrate binding domain-containing protein [Candidatus Omnitrophota bacterium]